MFSRTGNPRVMKMEIRRRKSDQPKELAFSQGKCTHSRREECASTISITYEWLHRVSQQVGCESAILIAQLEPVPVVPEGPTKKTRLRRVWPFLLANNMAGEIGPARQRWFYSILKAGSSPSTLQVMH
jgi:hypothetical protein